MGKNVILVVGIVSAAGAGVIFAEISKAQLASKNKLDLPKIVETRYDAFKVLISPIFLFFMLKPKDL